MAKIAEDFLAKLAELNALRKKAIRGILKERRKMDRQLAKLGFSDDPSKAPRTKKRICGTCGKTGHNSRTCPMAKAKKG